MSESEQGRKVQEEEQKEKNQIKLEYEGVRR